MGEQPRLSKVGAYRHTAVTLLCSALLLLLLLLLSYPALDKRER